LAYLFPKCPHHIKKKIKKKRKNQKIYKYMLGWPNHTIGGGRPPRLAWGGSATPRSAGLGAAKPPGVVWPPLGPIAQNFVFGRLAQGIAEPPPGPLGVVQPPPDRLAWGGSATPTYIYIFFGFFFYIYKCDGGILEINMSNMLNCHNLKVWGVKHHT
jgi:hypothetical protein